MDPDRDNYDHKQVTRVKSTFNVVASRLAPMTIERRNRDSFFLHFILRFYNISCSYSIITTLLSAFFSSAETSLTTVNKIKMRSLAEEGNNRAKMVIKVTDNSSKMLSAILIGNNIVNLSASSLTTTIAYKLSDGATAVAIATGIITILILIFGEITPKTMATIKAEKMALSYAHIIRFLIIIFGDSTKSCYAYIFY